MLNAVRPNRIPIVDDRAAHNHVLQQTANKPIAESSAAIFPFDEFRPVPRSADQMLDEWARARTHYPENAQIDFLRRLAFAAESRDGDSGSHPHRVGELAALIGRSLNFPEHRVELIRIAASLHDIGKIGIPDNILQKPEKLTAGEYEKIKTHTTIGSAILSGSRFHCLQMAEAIALYHHERWDGNGYAGVKSEAIPVEARIVSIADTFDVLTHQRAYKHAWSVHDAITEIDSQSGRQFDPHLVAVFTRVCSGGFQDLTDNAGKTVTQPPARTICSPFNKVVNNAHNLSSMRRVSQRIQ
jgi:HD-GYP domain-containing protein (c-di-GMP phosphodiesterase class II)